VDVVDHFAELGEGLVSRMTAAFLNVALHFEEDDFATQGMQVAGDGWSKNLAHGRAFFWGARGWANKSPSGD